MTLNDGVEKPNSEPGVQDLESNFCRHRLSCRGTVSFLIRFTVMIHAPFKRFMPRCEARFDGFHAMIPSVSEPHSHDAPAFQYCASSSTASIARPLWFFRAA